MAVVDTSFLVALYDRRDNFHSEARSTSLLGQHLLVPCEVWQEFCQIMMRGAPGRDLRETLTTARSGPFDIQHVTKVEDVVEWASSAPPVQARLKEDGMKPMSLADLIVCRLAQRRRDSVLTFDRAMGHAISKRIFPGARIA